MDDREQCNISSLLFVCLFVWVAQQKPGASPDVG